GVIAAAAVDRGMVHERHSADRARVEVAAVGGVARAGVAGAALLREEDLGLDVAKEVVLVELLLRNDEVRAWVDRCARRAGGRERQRRKTRASAHALDDRRNAVLLELLGHAPASLRTRRAPPVASQRLSPASQNRWRFSLAVRTRPHVARVMRGGLVRFA